MYSVKHQFRNSILCYHTAKQPYRGARMTSFNLLAGKKPYLGKVNEGVQLGPFICQGVLEVSLRDQYRMWGKNMSVVLVSVDGGYAIRAVLGQQNVGVFVASERAKTMRVFKTADSALRVCRKLGMEIVAVEL
jgi:hypothetical protein